MDLNQTERNSHWSERAQGKRKRIENVSLIPKRLFRRHVPVVGTRIDVSGNILNLVQGRDKFG
jgi:hypothetical protein